MVLCRGTFVTEHLLRAFLSRSCGTFPDRFGALRGSDAILMKNNGSKVMQDVDRNTFRKKCFCPAASG